MRKIVAILLLCCFTLVTAGYHLFYHYHLSEAKKEMKKRLSQPANALVTTFVFSPEEAASLGWENKTEFCYRGEMYDVISLEKTEAKTIIFCIADTKETALLEHYFKTQKQSGGHSPASTIHKLVTAYFLPTTVAFLQTPAAGCATTASRFLVYLPNYLQQKVTPPPRLC